jgi:ankyrin repeat protein
MARMSTFGATGNGRHCIINTHPREDLLTRQWLFDHGADVNAWQHDGWTTLHWHLAAFNSHPEISRILLEHDADVFA